MAYISLYRKYRPQTFEDVVGQEHVTRTLRNAIVEGRVASGYLFCGTRGTAKTTCARVLAKALNCIGPDGRRTTPNPEPCSVCGPCRSIAASSFVDVLEMDAASHGKVDDVRDLVASIKFPPMEGRYKVYIIDEAHQLSRDAMDAFLKTLEEPPDRVVFVLATTEQDKLPITISSRCQVFEFKRGSVTQIGSRLTQVLQAEGVTMEPAAVTLVARAADGSYRDSLSLLEQVLAYKREDVTARDVGLVLGSVDEDLLSRVIGLVAASDAPGAFALAGDVLESGRDVRQFLKSVSSRMRDLLFVGVGAQPASAGDLDDSPALRTQATQFAPSALLQALQILTEAEQETRRNNQHRLLLEMTLLRLMHLPTTPNVGVGSVVPMSFPAAPTAAPILVPVPTPVPPAEDPVPRNGTKKTASAPPPPIVDDAPSLLIPEPVFLSDDTLLEIAPPLAEDDLSDLADDDEEMPETAAAGLEDEELDILATDENVLPSLLVTSADEHAQTEDFLQVQQVARAVPVVPDRPPPPVLSKDDPPELQLLQKSWQEVINRMGSRSPSGVGMVKDAKPTALQGKIFTLQFSSQFNVDRMESNARGRKAVEDIINKTLDVDPETYKIKCVMQGDVTATSAKKARTPAPKPVAPQEDSPLLDEVIAVFGGRVLDDGDGKG